MDTSKKIINFDYIDVNDPVFYSTLQDEIESDLARMKKSVEIVRNLRMMAAEMEVETAALYHAELWRDIEDLKTFPQETNQDSSTQNASQN